MGTENYQLWRMNVSSLDNSFDNFRVVVGTKEAYESIKSLADGSSPVPFVFVYGGVGNGKSHLLEALVIGLNKRLLYTYYNTWSSIVTKLKAHMAKDAEPSSETLLERYCHAPRLVIDDIGMGTTDTEWQWSQLERIVTERYRFRLLTAMATNIVPTDLPERILSRLKDRSVCAMVLNKAGDYRKSKK